MNLPVSIAEARAERIYVVEWPGHELAFPAELIPLLPELSFSESHVLFLFLVRAAREQPFFYSHEEIAKEAGWPVARAKRAARSLERRGIVHCIARGGGAYKSLWEMTIPEGPYEGGRK